MKYYSEIPDEWHHLNGATINYLKWPVTQMSTAHRYSS